MIAQSGSHIRTRKATMETSAQHPDTERTRADAGDDHYARSPAITLVTAFGLGKSYIFYVEKAKRARAADEDEGDPVLGCWKELFKARDVWDFEQLESYNKPLGETAKLTLTEKSSGRAAALIKELRAACEAEISAELDPTKIEAIFFTTGVAVLSLRLEPREKSEPDNILKYTLSTDAQLKRVHRLTEEIIKLCKAEYISVMEQAEKRGHGFCPDGSRWFLRRFREVDREDWEPALEFSYPLFFVGDQVYEQRTRAILEKVAGSKWRRKQQSDKARVSYEGAEIYVDWSEALVRRTGKNRERIENNFIIALASWYALVLMNKNSSIFLFQAYIQTVRDVPRQGDGLQEIADAVNKRNMAYKDVADASLPIRWTPQRRDLFLLEAIHRNWSSDRWRKNIDERMKLLVLHYRSLEDRLERMEDDRRERATNKLNRVAVMLAAFTLASATADVINLLDNGGNRDGGSSPLKTVGLILSLAVPILVWTALSLWLRLSEKRDRRKSAVSPDGPQKDAD